MKKVEKRAIMCLLLGLFLIAGVGFFVYEDWSDGADWVVYEGNRDVFADGDLAKGGVYDANGELLMKNTSEDLRKKEAELLDPIRKRIDDAIKIIGEEQGFMLIYDVNEPGVAFLGPQFEDITSLVKLQLGL